MEKLGHGADVESMVEQYGKKNSKIIDFSSNINPEMPGCIDSIIKSGADALSRYPDIEYRRVRKNISEYLDIDMEYVIPGNGATELIYLLMKNIGKKIAIINPTFSEYRRSATLSGLEVVDFVMDSKNGFRLDIDEIESRIDEFDSLFICNPNNPDGKLRDIYELMDIMKKHGKLLIVDETFIEFSPMYRERSLVSEIETNRNLFIIRAATKFFGMPGIRLGYALTSNKEIIDGIYRYKEPWSLNSFADAASEYIFKESEYMERSRKYFEKEIEFMTSELKKIKGINVYETDTNFILIRLDGIKASEIRKILFERADILIRDASNFIGLDDSFIRVAVKKHEENIVLINAISSVMGLL